MGQHLEAYYYAKRHLEISRDTGDRMGQATAQLNLTDLCRTLGYTPPDITELPHERKLDDIGASAAASAASLTSIDSKKSRRVSMEHMDLIKMTPDPKKVHAANKAGQEDKENNSSLNKSGLLDEEDFFDFISRFQSKRMDDQRCSLTVPTGRGKYEDSFLMSTTSSIFFSRQTTFIYSCDLLYMSKSRKVVIAPATWELKESTLTRNQIGLIFSKRKKV